MKYTAHNHKVQLLIASVGHTHSIHAIEMR
jgi:hypothetical protein